MNPSTPVPELVGVLSTVCGLAKVVPHGAFEDPHSVPTRIMAHMMEAAPWAHADRHVAHLAFKLLRRLAAFFIGAGAQFLHRAVEGFLGPCGAQHPSDAGYPSRCFQKFANQGRQLLVQHLDEICTLILQVA